MCGFGVSVKALFWQAIPIHRVKKLHNQAHPAQFRYVVREAVAGVPMNM